MNGKTKLFAVVRDNLLLLLTLLGVILGICFGFAVRPYDPSSSALMWLGLPGQLYLSLLKMMIVPLIVSSVISGTAALDPKVNGKISMVAFVFIFITNMIGAILGVGCFLIFRPGTGGSEYGKERPETEKIETQDIFADLLRNIFPDNLFEATFSQVQTAYKNDEESARLINISRMTNGSWINVTEQHIEQIRYLKKTGGANILGLIFACTLLGIAASSLKENGRQLIELTDATTNTVIVVMRWFLWLTPIGVLSLSLVAVAGISDVSHVFHQLAMFILAVTSGLVVQQLAIMPLILFATTRTNPYRFLLDISRPWLIAFAAASTAVTLPEMLNSCEDKLRVDRRVSRFVVPFSVAISANGSAVFIACSCLFISNLTGISVSVSNTLVISVLTTIVTLAIPSAPSASIVTIIMILTSLHIPIDAIALLLAVEFFLDRLRTTSSVVSHCMCAVVTNHICRADLQDPEKYAAGDEVELDIIAESEETPLKYEDQDHQLNHEYQLKM